MSSAKKAVFARLAEIAQTTDRPAHLGKLRINVAPSQPLDAATVRRYEDLGVDQLIIHPPLLPGPVEEVLERHIALV